MWNDGTELYHHGIKGQKWGVRRYQNPDGTLTAEGKARYKVDAKENLKLAGKAAVGSAVSSGIGRTVAYNLSRKAAATAANRVLNKEGIKGSFRYAASLIPDIANARHFTGAYGLFNGEAIVVSQAAAKGARYLSEKMMTGMLIGAAPAAVIAAGAVAAAAYAGAKIYSNKQKEKRENLYQEELKKEANDSDIKNKGAK